MKNEDKRPRLDIDNWNGQPLEPGQRRNVELVVTQSFSGRPMHIPVHVWRAKAPGPTVAIIAAVHGDEVNGTGAVRALIQGDHFQLERGGLILVPVINIPGYEYQSRYLPDRRDLNRSFPGSATGSMASRLACFVFEQIVGRSDYIIDLHSAAVRRTNFHNVRADLSNPEILRIAKAFGCELVVDGKGPQGSLRRTASQAGCPTIILEAGEVLKVEPSVVEVAIRGVRNVLIELGMITGKPRKPVFQTLIKKTVWVRAENGGFLLYHISPGDIVEAGQPIATNTNLLGDELNTLEAPVDGIVLGMTTYPSVTPGDAVVHLAQLHDGLSEVRRAHNRMRDTSLHQRMRGDLATNFMVTDVDGDGED
ncbi:MAG: succinylglutamate desuccinylase/aspartoacylase family protein [Phycisphaerae bacterium]